MVIENAPRAARPWWVAVVSGAASYIDAAALIGFGTAIVILQAAMGLTPLEVGLVSGSLTFGVAIGALAGGGLGDRLGRRPVFTVTMVLILLGVGALILAPSFTVILAASILLGLGVGADLPVSLSTISEAATDANRGRLIAFSNLLWIVGIVVSMLLGSLVAPLGKLGADIIFAHVGVVALLTLIGRLTVPESASWKAARAERLAGVQTVRAEKGNILALLKTPYVVPFLALIAFYALTNLTANTAGQYNVYLLVNKAGVPVELATLLGLPGIPVTILLFLWFMKIADKPSRFRYFTVGAICTVLAPLTYVIFGINLPTFFVNALLSTIGSAFAFEGIMKIWTQISFPTLLRTTAQGAIIAIARFIAAGVAGITPLLLSLGATAFYGALAALSLVGLTWVWIVFRARDQHNEFTTEAETVVTVDPSAGTPLPAASAAK